jgi:hypothetical protein
VVSGGTGTTTSTGTGNVVLSTSPTLVTPVIGAATGTSLVTTNGVVATGSFGGTLTTGAALDYSAGQARISVGGAESITFYTGGVGNTSIFKVDSTGAIGVGLSSPNFGTSGQVLKSNGPGSASSWGDASGSVLAENNQIFSSNYVLPATKNALALGPITMNSGISLTVGTNQQLLIFN